jgi:hypothetical protein
VFGETHTLPKTASRGHPERKETDFEPLTVRNGPGKNGANDFWRNRIEFY